MCKNHLEDVTCELQLPTPISDQHAFHARSDAEHLPISRLSEGRLDQLYVVVLLQIYEIVSTAGQSASRPLRNCQRSLPKGVIITISQIVDTKTIFMR